MALAKLPLVKELAELSFTGTPINGGLIEQLSGGAFLAGQRNVVLVGGTEPASYCPPFHLFIIPALFAADHRTADDAGAGLSPHP